MFWCSLLSFPSIYATTFTWSNFPCPLHICYHTLFVKQHICHSVRNYYQHISRYVFVLACHNLILMSYCQIRMIRIYAAYVPLFGVHNSLHLVHNWLVAFFYCQQWLHNLTAYMFYLTSIYARGNGSAVALVVFIVFWSALSCVHIHKHICLVDYA